MSFGAFWSLEYTKYLTTLHFNLPHSPLWPCAGVTQLSKYSAWNHSGALTFCYNENHEKSNETAISCHGASSIEDGALTVLCFASDKGNFSLWRYRKGFKSHTLLSLYYEKWERPAGRANSPTDVDEGGGGGGTSPYPRQRDWCCIIITLFRSWTVLFGIKLKPQKRPK